MNSAGPQNTKAKRELNKWLERHTQTELARAVGVYPSTVRDWALGVRPSVEKRPLIEAATLGTVKTDDWMTSAERKAMRAAVARIQKAIVTA